MAERDWDRERDWERGRRYRDESSYGGYYTGERDYGRRRDERGFIERLRDELRAWFAEDEPERRRREEREAGRWGGSQDVDPEWARQWGYLEGRGQRGAERGSARGWGYSGGYGGGAGPEYGYGGPMGGGWGWSARERYGRQASAGPSSGSGDAPPPGRYDDEGERYGAGRGGVFRGSFAGRGPRGYQRSDERIREDVCERMCDSAELDASAIEILVLNGEVTLQGTVSDRYDKRLAEDLTERVSGVRDVNNQLRVTPGGSGQDDQRQQSRPGDPPRYRVA